MLPMDSCPQQYDKNAIYDGVANTYEIKNKAQKVNLNPVGTLDSQTQN